MCSVYYDDVCGSNFVNTQNGFTRTQSDEKWNFPRCFPIQTRMKQIFDRNYLLGQKKHAHKRNVFPILLRILLDKANFSRSSNAFHPIRNRIGIPVIFALV